MAKFFRGIRRKSIKKSHLKNYLLYAIGEILLVMIGILLALQVNTWNENRKTKNELIQSLHKLNENLREDSLFIKFCKSDYEYNYQMAMNLWDQLYKGKPIPATDTFIIETQSIGRTFSFELNDDQYSSMVSNNILNTINNDTLKIEIEKYYNSKQDNEIFSLLWERTVTLNDLVVDAIPLEAHLPILQHDLSSFSTWAKNAPNVNDDIVEKLKSEEKLKFNLKNVIRTYLLCIDGLKYKAEMNIRLRKEINAYISKSITGY